MASKLIVLLFAVCLIEATFARYVNEHGDEEEHGPKEPDFVVSADTAVEDAKVGSEVVVDGSKVNIGFGRDLGLRENRGPVYICGIMCIVTRSRQICKWRWTYKTEVRCPTAFEMHNCRRTQGQADQDATNSVVDQLKQQGKC